MMWIEVTEFDGKKMMINFDHVSTFFTADSGITIIFEAGDNDSHWEVRESYKYLKRKIEGERQ